MPNEEIPKPGPGPTQPWFARLGTSGKLIFIGGLAGIIVAFLPLVSVSVPSKRFSPAEKSIFERTIMVVQDWRGKVCIACYSAALLFAFMLYPPKGLGQKALCWGGVGAGVLAVLLAIWLLVLPLETATHIGDTPLGDLVRIGMVKATVGIGAFLNILAGAAVAAGGIWKAKQEKLI